MLSFVYSQTAPEDLHNQVCRQVRILPALTFALLSFGSLSFSNAVVASGYRSGVPWRQGKGPADRQYLVCHSLGYSFAANLAGFADAASAPIALTKLGIPLNRSG